MILEGVVTTTSAAGVVNVAPMGPLLTAFDPDGTLRRFTLRPFRTAQTYANLRDHPEGVLHVTDDVLLLARAAIGPLDPAPKMRPARHVRGWVLADACRHHEFRVLAGDDTEERTRLDAEVVHTGRGRDFFGFNRGKHAVLEAAILATRLHLLGAEEVRAELGRLAVLVDKTGGTQEHEAFAVLQRYVQAAFARERGPIPPATLG
jgi:hypothetical protein